MHKHKYTSEEVTMPKWKEVRVKQELVEEVEKELRRTGHKDLSDFVSDAIQNRLQTRATMP